METREIKCSDPDIEYADVHWSGDGTAFIAQRERGAGTRSLMMFNRDEAEQVIRHLTEFVATGLANKSAA